MSTNNQRDDYGFAAAWRAFKAEEAMLSAPPSVFEAVMDACGRELERRNKPPEPRRRQGFLFRRRAYLMMAAAVALMLAAAVVNRDHMVDSPAPTMQPSPTPPRVQDALESESLQIVRVRMPREALQIFGVSLIEPQAESVVDVELIVADDGLARGIRSVTAVVEGVPQE